MRFAESAWLLGLPVALLIALLLVWGALRQSRALSRFAAEEQLSQLLTSRPSIRRMVGGILLVSAVALAFLAAAAPQYGNGTRLLPRTNLDVVLVLDYSKSMYARDVTPSRIERSKIEVARLIQRLGGARFGAVAFAGEPMAFPLTSDGGAIAQFFLGLTPHDMPVGGTATARAIEAGRQLLLRDPLAKNHEKVMVLITDGEDLEGDPKAAAETAHGDGITINVVQIGGTSPEPIPDVDEHGQVHGFRRDNQGAPLTTYLTPEGEKQLSDVATAAAGRIVRAGQGDTGIDEMADSLRRLMTEELTERVETVYADVFQYPLALAAVFLIAETFVQLGRRRRRLVDPPLEHTPRRKPRRLLHAALASLGLLGCEPYDRLFERDSPIVEEARQALREGDGKKATELLTAYLEAGECQEGVIGFGARARAHPNASFDLGLAFGRGPDGPGGAPAPPPAPGAPNPPGGALPGLGLPPSDPQPIAPQMPGGIPGAAAAPDAATASAFDCALRLLAPLADAESEPASLRARALYLMGQIEMRKGGYRAAAEAYTRGLKFAPAAPSGSGDSIGQDLAFNRAVALKRALEKEKQEEEQKKKEEEQKSKDDSQKDAQDEPKDDSQKDGQDEPKDDSQKDAQDEPKDDSQKDAQDEPKDEQDKPQQEPQAQNNGSEPPNEDPAAREQNERAGKDGQQEPKPSDGQQQPAARAPEVSQDDRILDQLEQAPTLQEQVARQRARGARGRTMEDK